MITERAGGLLHTTGHHLKLLFAAAERHLPTSGYDNHRWIQLEIHDGHVLLVTTDRRSLAVIRWKLTIAEPGFTTAIMIRPWSITAALARVNDDDTANVALGCSAIDINGHTVHGQNEPARDWRATVRPWLCSSAAATSSILLDPAVLARLENAKHLVDNPAAAPMQFHLNGPDKPVVATLGTVYLALIAPIVVRQPQPDAAAEPTSVWAHLINQASDASSGDTTASDQEPCRAGDQCAAGPTPEEPPAPNGTST